MGYVKIKLGEKGGLSQLSGRRVVESEKANQWLMIGKYGEGTAVKEVSKMFDEIVNCQKFPIKSRVILLCRV